MILCRFETVGMFYWGVAGALMRVCACHFQFQTTSTQMKHCCLFKVEYMLVYLTSNKALFAKMNPYPQKKIMTFNKFQDDFQFNANLNNLDHLEKNEIR